MTNFPTDWQRRVLWTVFTYLAIVAGGAVAVWLILLFGKAVNFLQPVLIPFALAAVLAFLLDPVVRLITTTTRLSRTWAVLVVFVFITLALGLLGVAVVPRIYTSTAKMVQGMPDYTKRAQQRLTTLLDATEERLAKFQGMFPGPKPSPADTPTDNVAPDANPDASASQETTPTPTPTPATGDRPGQSVSSDLTTASGSKVSGGEKPASSDATPSAESLFKPNGVRDYIQKQIPTLENRVPAVLDSVLHLLLKSLGWAGVLLDLIIIPVYLYFLLVESRNIARHWNEYLPLRDSPFKKEVVSCLLEINGYLVAFFRGQLLVSTIDGLLIGGALAIMGLDFSFFIGLLVVVLTFIPYLGIILCYIPAVLIAFIQYGDFWHPLYVVAIMLFVQTLESTIISPKIVGDSVGLHPVTVILSVFGWSLLLDGPIGAILAVPLSATIKVLLRRYIWEASGRGRHFVPLSGASMAALADESRRAEESKHGGHEIPPLGAEGRPNLGLPEAIPPTAETRSPGGTAMPSAGLPTPPPEPRA